MKRLYLYSSIIILIAAFFNVYAEDWIVDTRLEFGSGALTDVAITGTDSAAVLELDQLASWWDPNSDWWDSDYRYRKQTVLMNYSDSDDMNSDNTVHIKTDLNTLIKDNKMNDDLSDLRLIYTDRTYNLEAEMAYYIEPSNGIEFDGTDDYVLISNSTALDSTVEFTFECWIKFNDISGTQTILDRPSDTYSDYIAIRLSSGILSAGYHNAVSSNYDWSANGLTANTWYNLAVVYNLSGFEFYIDGVQVMQDSNLYTVSRTSALNWIIGANNTALDTYADFFNGEMDEIRFSNIVRYSFDYSTTLPYSPFEVDGNTKFLFHCDENYIEEIADAGINSYNGILTNGVSFTKGYIVPQAYGANIITAKMPSGGIITAGSNKGSIYMYYGNPLASSPNSPKNIIYYNYLEDFEYVDAIDNEGWTIEAGTATAGTSTAYSLFDDYALQVNSVSGDYNIEISNVVGFPSQFKLTSYFWDDATDTTKIDWMSPGTSVTPSGGYYIGVNTDYSTTRYSFYNGTTWVASGVARTTNWHKFEWCYNGSSMDYYIDGLLIYSRSSVSDSFDRVYIKGGTDSSHSSVSYWDEIYISSYIDPDLNYGFTLSEIDSQNLSGWAYRQNITIKNTSALPLRKGYVASVTIDHAALVSAAQSNADGSDIRIVYINNSDDLIELPRMTNDLWDTNSVEIFFPIMDDIGSSQQSTRYYMYFGNTTPNMPIEDESTLYPVRMDFEEGEYDLMPLGMRVMTEGSASVATIQDVTAPSGSKSLALTTDTTNLAGIAQIATFDSYFKLEFWAKGTVVNGYLGGFKEDPSLQSNDASLQLGVYNSNFQYLDGSTNTILTGLPSNDQWYKFVLYYYNGTYDVYVYDSNDVELGSSTGIIITNEPWNMMLQVYSPASNTHTAYFDDLVLSRYIDILPTVTVDSTIEYGYKTSGDYISQIYDLNQDDAMAYQIDWVVSSSGSLVFEVRADNDKNNMLLYPDTGWNTVSAAGVLDFDLIGRYVQFKITFTGDGTSPDPSIDNVTVKFNSPPDKPVGSSPYGGMVSASEIPILQTENFSDINSDTHYSSQWQIRLSNGTYGGDGSWDSGETTSDLTSYQLTSGILSNFGSYYWRVRFSDGTGWSNEWSEYSDEIYFSVNSEASAGDGVAPELFEPLNGETIALTPTPDLDWSDISGNGISYELQVADDVGFVNVVYSDTTSVSNYTMTYLENGIYYWRVRAVDENDNYGVWSVYWMFTIDVPLIDNESNAPSDSNPDVPSDQDGGSSEPAITKSNYKKPLGLKCFISRIFK